MLWLIFLLDLSRTHAQHPIFRIGWFLLNNWEVITELLCIRLRATKLRAAGNDGISPSGGGGGGDRLKAFSIPKLWLSIKNSTDLKEKADCNKYSYASEGHPPYDHTFNTLWNTFYKNTEYRLARPNIFILTTRTKLNPQDLCPPCLRCQIHQLRWCRQKLKNCLGPCERCLPWLTLFLVSSIKGQNYPWLYFHWQK